MSRFFAVILLICSSAQICFSTLPADYQSLPAETKQTLLWNQVNKNVYPEDQLPTDGVNFFSLLRQLWPSQLTWAFTHTSDERTPGKARIIHPYGSVAKVKWEIYGNSTYTGIFRAGSVHPAILRASIATVDKTNFIPGIALKVLIDGKPSGNMVALNSLDGQGANKNFFAKKFSTIIPDSDSFSLKFLSRVFAYALTFLPGGPQDRPENPNNVPVYELAKIDETGAIIAPYGVTFIPLSENGWDPKDQTDFRKKLAELQIGTTVYYISARRTSSDPELVIGKVTLESQFVASFYGDGGLFFQHPSKRWRDTR